MWPSGQSSHLEVPSKIVGLDMSMVVDGTARQMTQPVRTESPFLGIL